MRFVDHDKMVRLIRAAEKYDMNVHIHSMGDASTRAWINAIAEVEEETDNFDMRNALAHLHMVLKCLKNRQGTNYDCCATCSVVKSYCA